MTSGRADTALAAGGGAGQPRLLRAPEGRGGRPSHRPRPAALCRALCVTPRSRRRGRAARCVNGCENRRHARRRRKRRDFTLAPPPPSPSAPLPPPWPPRGRRGSSGPPPLPPAAGCSPPPRRQPGRGRAAAALPGGQHGRSASLPGRCSGKGVTAVWRQEGSPGRRPAGAGPGRGSALRTAGASGCLWHGPPGAGWRGMTFPRCPWRIPAAWRRHRSAAGSPRRAVSPPGCVSRPALRVGSGEAPHRPPARVRLRVGVTWNPVEMVIER